MMSRASRMYDHYVKPYLGEKGQDLVEYALLLAIVVGIGFMIYQASGMNANLQKIFTNANSVTSSAAVVSSGTSGGSNTNSNTSGKPGGQ